MPDNIPFGEWRPDLSDRTNPTAEALGVLSIAGQYAPFNSIANYCGASTVDANTTALLHFDGPNNSTAIVDDAPVPSVWTANGAAKIDTSQSEFAGSSGLFSGAASTQVTAPSSTNFNVGSGNFTVDF